MCSLWLVSHPLAAAIAWYHKLAFYSGFPFSRGMIFIHERQLMLDLLEPSTYLCLLPAIGRTSSVGFLWPDRTGQWIYFTALLCASGWAHPTSHGCNISSSTEDLVCHCSWSPSSWHPSVPWACRSWMVGNPLPCLCSHESHSAELLLCSECLPVCLSCCCLSHCVFVFFFPWKGCPDVQNPHIGTSYRRSP